MRLVTTLVLLQHDAGRIIPDRSADDLWTRWIPGAYDPPEDLYDTVTSVCAITTLWVTALERLSMPKLAKEVTKPGSPLGTSISGLPAAGVTLALAERSQA